jgi:hypothetical protein
MPVEAVGRCAVVPVGNVNAPVVLSCVGTIPETDGKVIVAVTVSVACTVVTPLVAPANNKGII